MQPLLQRIRTCRARPRFLLYRRYRRSQIGGPADHRRLVWRRRARQQRVEDEISERHARAETGVRRSRPKPIDEPL